MLKRVAFICSLFLIAYGFYLNACSVLHGEINFFNDVARDFLLLRELDSKIILIGPRANSTGLFHGPLWTYINYPAFVIGHGNPIIVGWYWLFLFAIFLTASFFIMKKLFSSAIGIMFVLLMEMRVSTFMNGLFHSLTPFFFIPIYFFTMYQYIKTKRLRYLVAHLISLVCILQLNVGVGGAMAILSCILTLFLIIKRRQWVHFTAALVIPIGLVNFIIFNLRHDFLMLKPVLGIASASKLLVPFSFWVRDRFNHTISLQILQNGNSNPYHLLEITFIITVLATIIRIKRKEHTLFYQLILYFYFGYMALSFMNKGVILGHFVFLLIPFTVMWIVSFLEKRYLWIFAPLVTIIFLLNFKTTLDYTKYIPESFSGKSPYSWISLSEVAQTVIQQEKGKEFGYYVFSPDAFAYQPRYAMIYHFEKAKLSAYEYVKKPTTIVIAAPPPPEDPYMNETWWIKTPVKISSDPISTVTFPSGYKVLTFALTPEEQNIQHDKTIELGISFR